MLIASHIKPWAKCDSNNKRIDKYNGLLLTPTYDKLFDIGFITIEKINKDHNAKILISTYLSDYNIKRLNIPTECELGYHLKRCEYLEYHKKTSLNRYNNMTTKTPLQNKKPQNKTKTTNIKKGEVRNPKGRGADLFKVEMSFSEAINKVVYSKK